MGSLLRDKFPHRVNLVSALGDDQLDRRRVYRLRGLQRSRTNARGLNDPRIIVDCVKQECERRGCEHGNDTQARVIARDRGREPSRELILFSSERASTRPQGCRQAGSAREAQPSRPGLRSTTRQWGVDVGDKSGGGTPGPISNPEVKSTSADGSLGFPHARVGHRQHSSLFLFYLVVSTDC